MTLYFPRLKYGYPETVSWNTKHIYQSSGFTASGSGILHTKHTANIH